MSSLVNFEIFGSGEHFATAGKWAGEWLLPSVYAYVIDQLVFGLEWASIPRTFQPKTGVIGALWAAHVLHRDMSDNFVHC